MKIVEGFMLHKVMDELLLVPTGAAARAFNGLITLNETGAFLFQCLREETTEEALTQKLLTEFEVSPELAAEDVRQFVDQMRQLNILQEGIE